MWDFSFFSPMTRSAEVDRWSRAGTSAAVRNMGSSFLLFHPQYVGFVLFFSPYDYNMAAAPPDFTFKVPGRKKKKKKAGRE